MQYLEHGCRVIWSPSPIAIAGCAVDRLGQRKQRGHRSLTSGGERGDDPPCPSSRSETFMVAGSSVSFHHHRRPHLEHARAAGMPRTDHLHHFLHGSRPARSRQHHRFRGGHVVDRHQMSWRRISSGCRTAEYAEIGALLGEIRTDSAMQRAIAALSPECIDDEVAGFGLGAGAASAGNPARYGRRFRRISSKASLSARGQCREARPRSAALVRKRQSRRATALAAAGLGRLVMRISVRRATSEMSAAIPTPACASSSRFASSISKPITCQPRSTRLRAMAPPMMPSRPMIPNRLVHEHRFPPAGIGSGAAVRSPLVQVMIKR